MSHDVSRCPVPLVTIEDRRCFVVQNQFALKAFIRDLLEDFAVSLNVSFRHAEPNLLDESERYGAIHNDVAAVSDSTPLSNEIRRRCVENDQWHVPVCSS